MRILRKLEGWLGELDGEDENEPGYDPGHLAGTAVVLCIALGVLYWLLWTALVYRGGIFTKLSAFFRVALTKVPSTPEVFEGLLGNTLACLLIGFCLVGLWRNRNG
ncbi:MAG: hypothetical protein HY402_06910 [Elusimicrobia bacterium]|nr:hypothetical protein [Elusimicrobiota bacterium]